jgi:hypothetical protein
VSVHPIKTKQAAEPDGRAGLAKAITDAKRQRSSLAEVSEVRSRTEESLARAAEKLEVATAAIEAAKTADCDDAIRKGGKTINIASLKAARAHVSDCQDEFDVASAAHARVQEDVRAAVEAVATADSAIFVERNKLISGLVKQLVDEGNELRRRLHARTVQLNMLLTVAAAEPAFDQPIPDALRVRLNAERSAAIAEARDLIRAFMVARPDAGDQAAADAASAKLRDELGKLIVDPSTELSKEK